MSPPAPDGQNILFIVMDTVRKSHCSVYGYEKPTTPNLEALAEEATVFEQALSPAPWTLPVHASMFTGLYPSQHGASQERPYLEGVTTLAERLNDAGYATACYSSNAWITPYTNLTAGFDEQDNFFEVMPGNFLSTPMAKAWKTLNDSDRLRGVADWLVSVGNRFHEHFATSEGADSKTPEVIDQTISFIDGTDDPYFAFINLMDAHLPYHPPQEEAERFAPGVDSSAVCQNSKEYNAGARSIDEEEWTAIKGLYDAEINHIDSQLARLFEWLRSSGEWEDLLVVVCADHGELHGEHDLYGHEFCLYDPLINVPLIVKHPDLPAERREDQVELLDLYHTVLDHASFSPGIEQGSAIPEQTDLVPLDRRRSLLADAYRSFEGADHGYVEYSRPVVELRQLENKATAANIDLPKQSRFYSRMRAVRRPDGKYIKNERIEDECYALDTDPEELHNCLSADDDADCAALATALNEFEATVGGWSVTDEPADDPLAEMSGAAKDRLEDLGYID